MTSPRERLTKLAAERILVFDGGYGTAIQNYRLGEEDYREMPWSRGLTLTVSREALLEAINQVEIFADWIERTE